MQFCESLKPLGVFNKIKNPTDNDLITRIVSDPINSVCLTFDDGPSEFTDEILNVLQEYGANATFFICGKNVAAYKTVLKRIVNEGHSIGIHGFDHIDVRGMSQNEFLFDVTKCENILADYGIRFDRIYRPPFGEMNQEKIDHLLRSGYQIYYWSIDSFDWKLKSEEMLSFLIKDSYQGDIILFHDGIEDGSRKETLSALKILLQHLSDNSIPAKCVK